MAKITYLPGEVANAAVDENGKRLPVTRTQHIFDDALNKPQSQVNEETTEAISGEITRAQNAESGLDTRLQTVEELAEISVGGGDIGIGTAADFESDDPSDLAKVPTVGAMLGGANDGVYDISARHNGTKYADLAAALGTDGINVPVGVRRGGMSVKFIQTDNRYVLYRLMADEWSTNTENWAIAEEGVYVENPEFVYVKTDAEDKILWAIRTNGDIFYGAGVPSQVVNYINEKIAELSLDEYEDIIAFLNDLEKGDKTLQTLLNEKVDKEEGKGLIPSQFIEQMNTPYLYALLDEAGKLIYGYRKDGSWLFPSLKIEDLRTHWFGKSWHAYGTSLTNINQEGKYAKYVSKLSGLVLHNHGISGGSIMHDGESIKGAIFNDTDGKTTADLITLECWANDSNAVFGDITDTGNTTFLGNLAQCIMHLQEVTNATIVIIISTMPVYALRNPSNRYLPTKVYNGGLSCEMADKMRKVCDMYGVYFINPNRALGNYRGGDKYYKDNIHHTELGGLVFARYIWSQLKNLPPFDTEVNI